MSAHVRTCSAAFPEHDLLRPQQVDRPRPHTAAPLAAAPAEAARRYPPAPALLLGTTALAPSDLVVAGVAAARGSCWKTWQSHDAISASLAVSFPQGLLPEVDDDVSGRSRRFIGEGCWWTPPPSPRSSSSSSSSLQRSAMERTPPPRKNEQNRPAPLDRARAGRSSSRLTCRSMS
jgi:hypothetical protein